MKIYLVGLLSVLIGLTGCSTNPSKCTNGECFAPFNSHNLTYASGVTNSPKSFKGKVFIGGVHIGDIKQKRLMKKGLKTPSNFTAPDAIDNSAYVAMIDDQGNLPECAARSEAAILSASYWRENNIKEYFDGHHLYYEAKKVDGDNNDGTYLESVLTVVESQSLLKNGSIPTIVSTNIYDTIDFPYAIHKYGFIWVALNITDNWYNPDSQGRIASNGNFIGGHAVVIVGYSKKCNLVKILNSWGPYWGDNGFCYLTMEEFERELAYGIAQYITWK